MATPKGRARLPGFAAAVARGTHLAIAKDALDALDRAEARGVPFEQAQQEIAASLRADWTTPASPRVKLTADNAVTQAMQLGRVTVLTSPEVAKRRPYWLFSAVLDDQTSETCIDCDGVCLPASHAWWSTHTPSLHLRCRSVIASCTEAQAKQLGITAKPPTVDVEEGFGRPGDLCDWEPRPGEYPAEVYDLIPMADRKRHLDLGVSDVHVPTLVRVRRLGSTDGIDFTPPKGAREEAERGLAWRREFGRGGTSVGIARARDIARGAALSPSTVRRMVSFFARHEIDKKGKGWSPGEDGFPSNGRIAWALWGGDPGRAWATKVTKQMDARSRTASEGAAHTMATLPTKKRNALPDNAFALPETRQFPIHDAAHVRNAAARLEQQKDALGPAKYAAAKRAIVKAAKRFGITTSLAPAAKKKLRTQAQAPAPHPLGSGFPRRRGLQFRVGFAGGHSIEVMHAKHGEHSVLLSDAGSFGVAVDASGIVADEERGKALEAQAKLIPEEDASRAEERKRLLSDAAAAFAAARAPRWNQIAKTGKFLGHPAGPFEMTPATFAEIERNYRTVDLGHVALDFEHASEAEATSGTIPVDGAPAQGWVLDLDNRGDAGLWGLIKFLEPALSYVMAGKYRAFSPAIRFGAKHPETGKPIGARLTSVALTNTPFLRGLAPLTASDRTHGATTMSLDRPMLSHDFMAKMRTALRCGDTDTMEKMRAKCADLRDLCATMDDAMMSQGVDLKPYMTDLAGLMNMPAHSTLAEILDAVEDMIDAAIARHVAEYHEGEGDDDDEPLSQPTGATMSDQKDSQSLAVTLGETKAALAVLTAEKAALMSERDNLTNANAALTLRLNDATTKLTAAESAVAEKDGVIVALKAEIAKRDAAALDARVTEAFETYREVKKLGDKERASMTIVLKSDPALFEEMYPRVAPSQQHLLRPITTGRMPVQMSGKIPSHAQPITAVTVIENEEQTAKMSAEQVSALADRLMSEKGLSLKAATIKAGNIASGIEKSPFAN